MFFRIRPHIKVKQTLVGKSDRIKEYNYNERLKHMKYFIILLYLVTITQFKTMPTVLCGYFFAYSNIHCIHENDGFDPAGTTDVPWHFYVFFSFVFSVYLEDRVGPCSVICRSEFIIIHC